VRKIIIMMAAIVGLAAVVAADPAEGLWKSISDVKGEEGKITAFWRISIVDGTLSGVIVHVPGDPDTKLYACKKKEFDQKPTLGTVWLYGLKQKSEGVWRDGKIVDVGNNKGDVYGCDVTIKNNGTVLNMKGYLNIIGMKIGREQNWQRASEADLAASQAETKAKLGL
jgi:uncharacterized protein (DUF2147 family)